MKNGAKCAVCKVVALLAGIGALNWGLVAIFGFNLVEVLLGGIPVLAKIVYILVGVAGLLLLVCLVKPCPCKPGSCGTETKS